MKIGYLTILMVLFCSTISFCQQFEVVQIPRPKNATYQYAQVEPSIAIHPKNPKKMIAGTVMNDYYFSRDGGKTWKSRSIQSELGVNGDPVMHISESGWYYYFHLSNPPGGQWIDRIVCERSKWICGK